MGGWVGLGGVGGWCGTPGPPPPRGCRVVKRSPPPPLHGVIGHPNLTFYYNDIASAAEQQQTNLETMGESWKWSNHSISPSNKECCFASIFHCKRAGFKTCNLIYIGLGQSRQHQNALSPSGASTFCQQLHPLLRPPIPDASRTWGGRVWQPKCYQVTVNARGKAHNVA